MANNNYVASLLKGGEILRLIGQARDGLRIVELTEILGMKQPTCYNLVRTLEHCHFLEKYGNRYYIGKSLRQIAESGFRTTLMTHLESELLKLFQQLPTSTVIYAVPGEGGLEQTHRISPDRPGVIQHLNHEPMHLYASAAGLLFLAFVKDKDILLKLEERWPYAEFGSNLWKQRQRLNDFLLQILQRKLAVSPFEQQAFLRISAPVLDNNDKLLAITGISIPAKEITDELMENAEKKLEASAQQIARILQ